MTNLNIKDSSKYFKTNCKNCNKELELLISRYGKSKNNFCGKACKDDFSKGKPNIKLTKKVEVKCCICNKSIKVQPYRLNNTKSFLCSDKCKSDWAKTEEISKNLSVEPAKVLILECDYCGGNFQKQRSKVKGKNNLCSIECRNEFLKFNNPNPKKEKVIVNCSNCEKELKIHESKFKSNKWNFCSRICYSEFRSNELIGERVQNYNSIEMDCFCCGKKVLVPLNKRKKNKYIFCSVECYQNKRIEITEFKNTGTSIHIEINKVLDNLKVSYINEKPIGMYSGDIYLKNYSLFIEIMGDYWHSNPNIYSFDQLNKSQINNYKNDRKKYNYAFSKGKIILYLWEKDIKQNIQLCRELILLYIDKKGKLDNYNSFNYMLSETNELKLNKNVEKPFFMT